MEFDFFKAQSEVKSSNRNRFIQSWEEYLNLKEDGESVNTTSSVGLSFGSSGIVSTNDIAIYPSRLGGVITRKKNNLREL